MTQIKNGERSSKTSHREVEAEMSKAEYKWKELEAQAQNCEKKGVVDGKCFDEEWKSLSQIFVFRKI